MSMEARRARVLRLKMAGGSDRDIARQLAADPNDPVTVSHKTINQDWHAGLDELVAQETGKAQQLRALAHQRLERIVLAHWPAAMGRQAGGEQPAAVPNQRAAEICMRAIGDIRTLYGLDRELGDPERPLTVEGRVTVDYSGLSTDELRTLVGIAERGHSLGGAIDGTGSVS